MRISIRGNFCWESIAGAVIWPGCAPYLGSAGCTPISSQGLNEFTSRWRGLGPGSRAPPPPRSLPLPPSLYWSKKTYTYIHCSRRCPFSHAAWQQHPALIKSSKNGPSLSINSLSRPRSCVHSLNYATGRTLYFGAAAARGQLPWKHAYCTAQKWNDSIRHAANEGENCFPFCCSPIWWWIYAMLWVHVLFAAFCRRKSFFKQEIYVSRFHKSCILYYKFYNYLFVCWKIWFDG